MACLFNLKRFEIIELFFFNTWFFLYRYSHQSTYGVKIRTAISSALNPQAWVVKLVDTRDLKSLDFTVVPVRFRLRAPNNNDDSLRIINCKLIKHL